LKIKVIKHRVDFSLYIEDDYNNKILFDVATIDVKKEYLYKFKKELDFDFIVLSHGHWDHGDGLKYFSNKKLICHSGSFIKRYRNKDKSYIGLNQTKQEIENKFELCLINSAKEIAKNVYFLGEISRKNDFEGKYTTFIKGNGEMDLVYDDSGICFITKKGLVIISGCSHSGICNIIEHSKKVTGIKDVYAVIGGFHLKYRIKY